MNEHDSRDIDAAGQIRMGEVHTAVDHADLHACAGGLELRSRPPLMTPISHWQGESWIRPGRPRVARNATRCRGRLIEQQLGVRRCRSGCSRQK